MSAPTSDRFDQLRIRLWVALPLTAVIVAVSMVPVWQFNGWQYLVALLTMPVVTWAAWPFHATAWRAAQHGSTTMDTLVSLGVVATTAWSLWALIFGGAAATSHDMGWTSFLPTLPPYFTESTATHAGSSHAFGGAHIYFEGAATIVTFLLLGRLLEARAKHSAGDALRSLLEMGAKTASLVTIDETGVRTERTVAASELEPGDLFLVRPGEKFAADGTVIEGASAVDTALLTGESLPVDVTVGDEVTGATLNTWGTLVVRARKVGAETTLAQMGKALADAQSGKAPIQRLADRISAVFVPVVIAIALATFVLWLLVGAEIQMAFTAAVSVLVVACPCALGLATPTALLVGSGRAAKLGALIRTPEVLESTRRIDTVVFDKTGTVTTGVMSLESVDVPADLELTGDEVLAVAAGIEAASEHPLARAIVEAAHSKGLALPPVDAFTNHPGHGVSALVRSGDTTELILLGKPEWLAGHGLSTPLADQAKRAEASGASAVLLARVPCWREDTWNHRAPATSAAQSATASSLAPDALTETVYMSVKGMTCASCVRRVERKLGKLDGVVAVVNLATESATITLTRPWDDAELEYTVNAAGYQGQVQRREARQVQVEAPLATAPSRHRVLPEQLPQAQVLGLFTIRDTPKAEASDAIADLKALGLTPMLASGDNAGAAHHVAMLVGIDEVHAGMLPHDKRALVAALREGGHTVAVVGDGVNDAEALAQADLGMAMGSGTDVAIDVAEVTLSTSSLHTVATAIRISRKTLRVIKQNLFWAFAYNVAMIPLAVLGMLNPMIASAAMAFSSVFVVLNSLRLKN
ncbi:heavy metal translocating P-type ATPase [Schaalia suimastitidis]|uniref:heavy metal translocating P-type ATPase n=1 Tax=Schaalia suimastitidis TaxID=121163 RepID=UPI0004276FBB|nr:heavy metal translocating P-type ATPase [Schaalia suimastitidis]